MKSEPDYKTIRYYESQGNEITREKWLDLVGDVEPRGLNNIYNVKRKPRESVREQENKEKKGELDI